MTTVVDRTGLVTSGDLIISSIAVVGGTLYAAATRPQGPSGGLSAPALFLAPSPQGATTRNMNLTAARSDVGATLTAASSGGALGIARTAGASLALFGESTAANAVTDKALWEFSLPDNYVSGTDITINVTASITGAGNPTGGSCTITAALYTEQSGVETALPITAAQNIVVAGGTLPFTVTGSNLVAGQHCVLELVMLVTSDGVNLGHISNIAYTAFLMSAVLPSPGVSHKLDLTAARIDSGAVITATASGGSLGVARTAGATFDLVNEVTSGNAKTGKALWEFNLPDSYIAGTDIPVSIAASISGAGTLTAPSCTVTLAVYTEVAGVETLLTVSAAQQIVVAGSTLVFTVTGTGLIPGQHLALEIVMLVTSASGANTGHIRSVAYQA